MPIEITINTLKWGRGLNSAYTKDLNFCNIKANIDSDIYVESRPLKITQIFNEDKYGRSMT